MSWNQAGNNISGQFGMPLYGIAGLPPFTGNFYWVDQTAGNDGNTGGPQDPFKTLSQAHSKCKANNNDVVFLTGTVHVSDTVEWSKDRTHLIGLAPRLNSAARARISQTGDNVFTPLVEVTADECIFRNIGSFHGFADDSAQICWSEKGQRNEYTNCLFAGMGAQQAADNAGSRSLVIDGTGGEHTFTQCQIGIDTIARGVANASLEFKGGTPRNVFRQCVFPALADAATPVFILGAAAACMDRFQWFQDCAFINAVGSTATTMTAAITLAASSGGMIFLQRSSLVGATDWATDTNTEGQVWIDGAAPTALTSGLAVNVDIAS